mgnify:CR=1 FL=1
MYRQKLRLASQLLLTGILTLSLSCSEMDNSFQLEKYRGKWLVINYWAEWCTPCIKEIPELNQLQAEYPSQIAIAAVNFDHLEKQALLNISKKMGINYEVLEQDPADILRLASPAALPTTYIYNPSGELSAKLVGPQSAESILSYTNIKPE